MQCRQGSKKKIGNKVRYTTVQARTRLAVREELTIFPLGYRWRILQVQTTGAFSPYADPFPASTIETLDGVEWIYIIKEK